MSKLLPSFISTGLIPLIMLGMGYLWKKHPPSQVNWIYGYRSKRSMKNKNTWDFAQFYQAKLWRITGWSLLLLSFLITSIYKEFNGSVLDWIICFEVAIMFATIALTEIKLRREFDREGNFIKKEY